MKNTWLAIAASLISITAHAEEPAKAAELKPQSVIDEALSQKEEATPKAERRVKKQPSQKKVLVRKNKQVDKSSLCNPC